MSVPAVGVRHPAVSPAINSVLSLLEGDDRGRVRMTRACEDPSCMCSIEGHVKRSRSPPMAAPEELRCHPHSTRRGGVRCG